MERTEEVKEGRKGGGGGREGGAIVEQGGLRATLRNLSLSSRPPMA